MPESKGCLEDKRTEIARGTVPPFLSVSGWREEGAVFPRRLVEDLETHFKEDTK